MAERQGLKRASRTRDARAIDYGRWFISDARTNTVVAGGHGYRGYDLDLDDVERYLKGES